MSISDNQDEVRGVEYLTSPKKFHLEMPLYLKFDLSDKLIAEKVYSNLTHEYTIDAYCTYCEKESVFEASEYFADNTFVPSWVKRNDGLIEIEYSCTRQTSHKYHIYYYKKADYFIKAGQVPSVADFQIPQSKKYRKILGSTLYKELTRGIGLAAGGVGIGAFVYLRRIFESLIEEAHQLALSDNAFDTERYKRAKMSEKIIILKEHLPKFLVENSSLYSILSTGIHSLDEQECLEYFNVVKIGIEQILDEKIRLQDEIEKNRLAKETVQAL